MKKLFSRTGILIAAAVLITVFAGCSVKISVTTGKTSDTQSSFASDTAKEITSEDTLQTAPSISPTDAAETTTVPAAAPGLPDYFPLTPDVYCSYSGTGNEFVSMTTYVEYAGPDTIQLVYDNGATESHILYAVRDGQVQALRTEFELYVREDLSLPAPDKYGEILLKEPLEVGTSWDVLDGVRTITGMHVNVTTPSGTYDALEVTTKGNDNSTAKQYYAPGIGFVKLVVSGNDYEVTQELETRTLDAVRTENRTFYYPRMTQTDIEIVYETIPVQMKTNDSFTDMLTVYLQTAPASDLHAVMSKNSVINSMRLDPGSRVVTVDLSANFVSEMNAGSGMEGAILQCLANTVGSAYGAQEIIVTLDGQLYESGHIALKEGETLKVDYDNSVELT
ncbi:MAG: GerMN domain-containing protein [Eubacteriales bacterium]